MTAKKLHDPVCAGCKNISSCTEPCPPVRWIDGSTAPRREPLLRDVVSDRSPTSARDYNSLLADALRARTGRMEDIREITNIRVRAIAAMVYVDITIGEIADIMQVSPRTIRRLAGKR
jgi:hypothetical protein